MLADEFLRPSWQPIGNIAERFQALCLKDSGVLYEDPYIQVSNSCMINHSSFVL